MQAVVQLDKVTKRLGGRTIIDSLTFDVYQGEVFGLLGPNGAGKTMTIRMIVGLMGVTEGTIRISGANITTDFEEAVQHVGAIVENPEMYPFLSGYENLLHYARMSPGVTKEKITELVTLVGLTDRINDKVRRYSLGMRQRLGIAQALLHDPKILILDEPLNGLDPAGIREMRDHLRYLAKEKNLAIIVSSHQLAEIEMMCDRIAIIKQGRLINIQMIHDTETTSERSYTFEVNDVDKAAETIQQVMAEAIVQKNEGHVISQLEKNQIPIIVKALVDNEVHIFGVKEITKTLEDRFLEITADERKSE